MECRADSGLRGSHRCAGSDNASVVIKQQQIAVATHELQNQHALNGLARSGRELKFHHALEPFLVELHKCSLAQAVLALLRHGAARTFSRWGIDFGEAG